MRRCASRKNAFESIIAAAMLKVSLSIRIAPSTDRSASRLCGSVRCCAVAVAVSGAMLRKQNYTLAKRNAGPFSDPAWKFFSSVVRPLGFLDDRDLQLRRHVAMQFHRNVRFTERTDRVRQQDLAAIDVKTLLLEQIGNVAVGHRAVE